MIILNKTFRNNIWHEIHRTSWIKKTYPEASGGNLTTTFPISAPGSSTNFPSLARPPAVSCSSSLCDGSAHLVRASSTEGVSLLISVLTKSWDSMNLYHRKILFGAAFFEYRACHCLFAESNNYWWNLACMICIKITYWYIWYILENKKNIRNISIWIQFQCI